MGGLVSPIGSDEEAASLVGQPRQAMPHQVEIDRFGEAQHQVTIPSVCMARAKKQIAKRAAARDERGSDRTVATNRRARREYEFIDTFEAGLVLQGSEVKSLREGKAQLTEAYARVDGGEMWLFQMHIPPWQYATGFGAHDPDRKRKLLLHRGEIDELQGKTQQQSLTLIPVSLYFKDGRAKIEIALAKGRRLYDKRNLLMTRDAEREAARAIKEVNQWGGS
jgi:SsrA-binding protein